MRPVYNPVRMGRQMTGQRFDDIELSLRELMDVIRNDEWTPEQLYKYIVHLSLTLKPPF